MLDLIYSESQGSGHTEQARQSSLFVYSPRVSSSGSPVSSGHTLKLYRRERSTETECPRILSIACGHLREAATSTAITDYRVGELIALDQDEASLEEVRRCYSCFGVRALHASIRSLLTGKLQLGRFDLIYAAGLYDYLGAEAARRLTQQLFSMLIPGGCLLISNFRPEIPAVGYMESFMAWDLIFRDEDEVGELASGIERSRVAKQTFFVESNENIIFMDLRKH